MDNKTKTLSEDLLRSFEEYVLNEQIRINLRDAVALNLISRAKRHIYAFESAKREAKFTQ